MPDGAVPAELRRVVEAVQANCHIADARSADELPLCIYLLQLRELYRWEQGLPFGATLARADLGSWIAGREALWEAVAGRDYAALPCADAGAGADPFDAAAVNRVLHPRGWTYGAGLLGPQRPAFFVAERLGAGPVEVAGETIEVEVCGREVARSLASPPAALVHGQTVVLRRAALARWLWERFEAHGTRAGPGAAAAMARHYGLADADAFNAALPGLLDDLGPVLLLHEVGERRAGRALGPGWGDLRLAVAGDRRAELRLRAVRDLMADCGTTLPALLDEGDERPQRLHFWFTGFEGQREALFPALQRGYAAWREGDGGRAMRAMARLGAAHFEALGRRLMARHAQDGDQAAGAIAALVKDEAAVCAG